MRTWPRFGSGSGASSSASTSGPPARWKRMAFIATVLSSEVLRRAVFALLLFASCMGPTEIVVDVTTNACTSLKHTDVYVNGQQVTQAPTPVCAADGVATIDIGTITLLPSHGIDSHVDITLVGDVGG